MEFKTPPSYGSTIVRVSGIATDGKLLTAGIDGDVKHLDFSVGEQIGVGGVDAMDAVPLGDGMGVLGVARGDGDRMEASLPVGDEVTVAHDEPGAHATDLEIVAPRQS